MSLTKLIEKTIDKKISDIQLGMICKIVSFDQSKMRADVQPMLKIKNDIDEEMDLPILADIPVLNFSGGGYYIRPFYEKDDIVWVGFSTHDIQNALQGYTRAASEKKFELHNACVLGGIYKDGQSMPSSFGGEGVLFGSGASCISVNKSGDIEIKSSKGSTTEKTVLGEKLKTQLEALLDGIIALTVSTPVGPSSPPVNAAVFTAIKAQLSLILSTGVKNN